MSEPRLLRFYLDDGLRQSAEAGTHNFIARITRVAEAAQYRVEFRHNSAAERLKSVQRRGYALFHMDDPFHARAMTLRRAYHYPFWAMERSAKRWQWRVAQTEFDAASVDAAQARKFYRFWQKRLFGTAPQNATRAGFVYVPLQGRIRDHRSFQTCAPLDMIRHTIEQVPDTPIVVTLHPSETYSAQDHQALHQITQQHARVRIETGQMERWLAECDLVVTQNSSAAFSGYFFGKPAVLFGQIDFHHIAANVSTLGVDGAFAMARRMQPDYAAYLFWFWQIMSINAGRAEADDQIRAAFARAGWPI